MHVYIDKCLLSNFDFQCTSDMNHGMCIQIWFECTYSNVVFVNKSEWNMSMIVHSCPYENQVTGLFKCAIIVVQYLIFQFINRRKKSVMIRSMIMEDPDLCERWPIWQGFISISGVWECLWEKVRNNLKCPKRYAFQCIQTTLKVWKWGFVKSNKVWNQIKSELSHLYNLFSTFFSSSFFSIF